MEKILALLDSLLQHVTVVRVFLVLLLMTAAITGLTLYENRQKVYDDFSFGKYNGDFKLAPPGDRGKKIISAFVARNSGISLVSIVDADPITNTRNPVYRHFVDDKLQQMMEGIDRQYPGKSTSRLFTDSAENNRQILAIMAGEFYCAPTKDAGLGEVYPDATRFVKYTCRVPLPPAFNKATGWFAIHLWKWPVDDIDKLKFDALSMSLAYYSAEIAEQNQSTTMKP